MSGVEGDTSSYTVTYKPGASGSGAQQTASQTHCVALTLEGAIFTRSGYTQTGWSTSDGGSKAHNLGASYTANAAITLYPYWTATDVWTDEWTDPDTGYTWTYRINGDTAEIFCYDESFYGGRTAISPYPTGAMTVPSMLGGKPVTRIGNAAFDCCISLTSVTIPSSVTSIGEDAFYDTALATVHVEVGDTDRVKSLIGGSGYDVSGVTFIEDVVSSSETPASLTPDPVTPDPVTPDPVSPNPVAPDPVTPGYEVIEATDIIAPYEAPKAVTLQGVIYDGGKVVGIVELKLGKVNAKKGTGKVSGSVSTLDGKKHTIKAFNLEGIDGTSPKSVTLEVKDFGTMTVTIGGTQFAGSMGKYHVQSAAVGGDWSKGGTKVYVDVGGASGGRALPEGTIEDLLPDGEPVIPKNGKWKFAKAASVKWAKPKQGAVLPERYDAESGKGLLVDTSGDKTNLSAMKLTYTPKKGTFKGSFKVYALEGSGKATKLKKYTIKVSGVVVGGVGHGTATCKKPAASWSVTVR